MESNDDGDLLPLRARTKVASGRGGWRPNSGRKTGSHNKMSMAAREAAAREGPLPHEILLSIARGEPQMLRIPTERRADGTYEFEDKLVGVNLEDVKDAAKAAAPYYAPKMSTVELLSGVSDDDLHELLKSAAAEAGVDLAAFGSRTPQPDQEEPDRAAGGSRERAA